MTHQSKLCRHGIIDMDTGKNIGGGVCTVNGRHQCSEKIFVCIQLGAQVLAIGKYNADHYKDGHTNGQQQKILIIFPFVSKSQIQQDGGKKGKPQEIGNDEYLQKGNGIIQGAVNYSVVFCDEMFNQKEGNEIKGKIEKSCKMFIVF